MKIINNVQIKDYRGLNNIDFFSESVNIIVGPNNTGKSSILEAIGLTISSLNNYNDIIDNNLLDILIEKKHYNPKYLITSGENSSQIRLEILNNLGINSDLILNIDFFDKRYPDTEIGDFFLDFIDEIMNGYIQSKYGRRERKILDSLLQTRIGDFERKDLKDTDIEKRVKKIIEIFENEKEKEELEIEKIKQKLILSRKLFFTTKANSELLTSSVIFQEKDFDLYREYGLELQEKTLYHNVKKAQELYIPIIFNINLLGYSYDIFDLYMELVKSMKIDEAIDALRERIPYFKDIREGSEKTLEVLLISNKESLPLSSMGDGFIALLRLTFMTTFVKNGIILMEEPEIALHPGYLEVLAEELIKYSDRSQFFFTTHSIELLQFILEKAEKLDYLDKIKIIKLQKMLDDGTIEREEFSGFEAKNEIEEIKSDLRGS